MRREPLEANVNSGGVAGRFRGHRRGRLEWTFFGMFLGIIAALAVNSDSSWVVRRQLSAEPWDGATPFNNNRSVELAGDGRITRDDLEASTSYLETRKYDAAVQIAGAEFEALATALETADIVRNYPTRFGTPDNAAAVAAEASVSERTLKSLSNKYPRSPLVIAAYLRALLTPGIKIERPERFWIDDMNAPEISGLRHGNGDYIRVSTDSQNIAMEARQQAARLITIENVAANGVRCDPHNSFFYTILAYAHYYQHQDGKALQDFEHASHADLWKDYSVELALGRQRLDTALFGRRSADIEANRFETGADYRCNIALRSVAMITVWKAIELEHASHYAAGIALRMRVARVGALCAIAAPRSIAVQQGHNLVSLSAKGAGGVFLQPLMREKDYERAARQEAVYIQFLERNRFHKEADWCAPIFKSLNRIAAREALYWTTTESRGDDSLNPNPAKLGAVGQGIAAEIVLVAIIGAALSIVGYRKRFSPKRNIYWSRSQWGAALGGCLISLFLLIASIVMYRSANAIPVVAILTTVICIAQLGLWQSGAPGSPATLLLQSLCWALGLFAAIGISSTGMYGYFSTAEQLRNFMPSPILEYILPVGAVLLVIPAVVAFGVVVMCRVRYLAVPSGLLSGARRAVLPVLSLLLVIWSANVIVISGIDKVVHAQTLQDVGLNTGDDAP